MLTIYLQDGTMFIRCNEEIKEDVELAVGFEFISKNNYGYIVNGTPEKLYNILLSLSKVFDIEII